MAKLSGKDTIKQSEQILADLRNKIYKPIYILMGDEAYYIDMICDYIANNVLPEAERSFNQTIVYGKDATAHDIIDNARRFPMMSNYQVLIVKEAQNIKNIEDLEVYAKNPLKSTILVICYKGKTIDKRKSFYKTVQKNGEIFESVKLYENEVAAWVSSYIKKRGFEIEPNAAGVLVDFLGNNLSKIVNELDKLFTLLPANRKKITAVDIEENIGISKDYNTFELGTAVIKRDAQTTYRIANHFAHNPREFPLVLIIPSLFAQFVRILKYHSLKGADRFKIAAELGVNPYFIGDYERGARNFSLAQTVKIISLLREYDMKSKGFNNAETDAGELLRELISKIFNS